MKLHLLLLLCLYITDCKTISPKIKSRALTKEAYSYESLSLDNTTLPYRLLLPENYNHNRAYPLVLFLHGAGERGNDNELQLIHGSDLFLDPKTRTKYPAIVVFPQCSIDSTWSGYVWKEDGSHTYRDNDLPPVSHQKLLKAHISKLQNNYTLDSDRLYIGGLSMGGMGTFETVKNNPKLFAAAFPICGGAHPDIASELTGPRWWIFHGEDDTVVKPENSVNIYEAMKAENIDVRLSLYPEVGHDSWTNAFAEPNLLEWLFSQKKD